MERAIENGAEVVAETSLFFVAVATVLWESRRNGRKNKKSEMMVEERLEELEDRVEELVRICERLEMERDDGRRKEEVLEVERKRKEDEGRRKEDQSQRDERADGMNGNREKG